MRRDANLAGLILATVLLSGPAAASETFYCSDGRRLQVTSENRTRLMDDPCVKAWFAQSTRAENDRERTGMTRTARFTRAGRRG